MLTSMAVESGPSARRRAMSRTYCSCGDCSCHAGSEPHGRGVAARVEVVAWAMWLASDHIPMSIWMRRDEARIMLVDADIVAGQIQLKSSSRPCVCMTISSTHRHSRSAINSTFVVHATWMHHSSPAAPAFVRHHVDSAGHDDVV